MDNGCQPVPLDYRNSACQPCYNSYGNVDVYVGISVYGEDLYVYGNSAEYVDYCEFTNVITVNVVEGSCDDSYASCTLFYQKTYQMSSLEVTSDSLLEVSVKSNQLALGKQSATELSLLSGLIINTTISNAKGYNLTIHGPISSSQYNTSSGVYNNGQQYSLGDLSWKCESVINDQPPSNLPPPISNPSLGFDVVVEFGPFTDIRVNSSSPREFGKLGFKFALFGDDPETDFSDVVLTLGDIHGVKNSQLTPPDSSSANIRWKFQGVYEHQNEFDFWCLRYYEYSDYDRMFCWLPAGYGGSFSGYEQEDLFLQEHITQSVDEMIFELF